MPWNYDDEEINGIVDANVKDSPPNPPAVNTASTLRSMLKSFWAAMRGQVSAAVDYFDDFVAVTETRINEVEAKADAIFEQFSMADGLGTYNAATGVATIKETGTTFTPVMVASQPKGKYFDISVGGTVNIFDGSPTAVSAGGKIISRGTKWDYIPPGDAAYHLAQDILGKFVLGQNLFDADTMVEVGGINAGGALNATVSSRRTTSIPVAASAQMIIFNRAGSTIVRFEDAAKALIGTFEPANVPVDAPVSFVTPAGIVFIRFTIRSAGDMDAPYDKLQVQYGADASRSYPYYTKINKFASRVLDHSELQNAGTSPKSVANMESVAKYAADKKLRSMDGTMEMTHNLIKPEYVLEHKYMHNNGSLLSGLGYRALAMPVTAGVTYKISGRGWNTDLSFFDNNTPARTRISSVATSAALTQFTVPAGATYLYTSLDNSAGTWAATDGTVQVYLGTVTLPYTPYGIKKFTLTHIEGSAVDFVSNTALAQYLVDHNIASLTTQVKMSHNLANPANIVANQYVDLVTGMPQGAAGTRYISVPVTPGKVYKISGRSWDIQLHFFDTNLPGRIKIQTIASTPDPATVTTPAGANYLYFTIDQFAADWPTTNANLMMYEGAWTLPYVAYGPVAVELTAINGVAFLPSLAGKKIALKDRESIHFWGNSYTEGYPSLPTKDYVSVLSQFSDWPMVNYGMSGDDVSEILTRVRGNSPRWRTNITPRTFTGGGYAVILELTNSAAANMISGGNGWWDVYLGHIDNLCDAARSFGLTPIVATEWQNNGGDMMYNALSQYTYKNGIVFADVYEKARFLRGADHPAYYAQNHPGVRTNSLLWSPLLPYIKSLPRPKWGIKIFRKRTFVPAASASDLAYKTVERRAELFREIRGAARTISDAYKRYFDDLATLSGLGFQITSVSEYEDLMDGLAIPMADYGLVEFVINATIGRIESLKLFIGAIGTTTYIYNHIQQAWDVIGNVNGLITLTNFNDHIAFDKISVLLYKASPFTITEPYIDFKGTEGKTNPARPQPVTLHGTNLVPVPHFNNGTVGWTVTGSVTPAGATDGSMPTLPVAITKIVPLTLGNYVSQAVAFAAAPQKRRAQLIVVARYNPAKFPSANAYPDASPITEDTFDFANVKITVAKAYYVNHVRQVGLWWQELVIDFDVIASDTGYTITVQTLDKGIEMASMSLVIEP